MEPFFRARGERFEPSLSTRGPWSLDHQHGGPPAALLVRALEQKASGLGEWQPARIYIEFVRPVPIQPLRIEVSTERSGRAVTQLGASLHARDKVVCRARGTFVRRSPFDVDVHHESPRRPRPSDGRIFDFPFFLDPIGYQKAMELRIVEGEWTRTPVTAWMRMLVPLLEGEEPTPLQRVVTAADSGSGIGPALDPDEQSFINPDLDITLHRALRGEWLGLHTHTLVGSEGAALAHTELFDDEGTFGYGTQTLVVSERTR